MVYKVFDKKYAASDIKSMPNQQVALKNFINQLLENSKDGESVVILKTIFGEMILLIWN